MPLSQIIGCEEKKEKLLQNIHHIDDFFHIMKREQRKLLEKNDKILYSA